MNGVTTRSQSGLMNEIMSGAQLNMRPGFQTAETPEEMFENGQRFPDEAGLRTPTTIAEEPEAPPRREEKARHGHPPIFTVAFHGGETANTARFVERCERYFAAADTDPEDKATKAATAFQGEALQWWQSVEVKPTSWEGFTFTLKRKYENLARKLRLEYEMRSVLQREDENLYSFLEKKRAMSQVCVGRGDPLELARDIQGLMTPRDQERTDRLRWTTLDELIEAVQTLELRSRREEAPLPIPAARRAKAPAPAETGAAPACGHQCRGAGCSPITNPQPQLYNVPPPPIPQSPRFQNPRRRSPERRPQQYGSQGPRQGERWQPRYEDQGQQRRYTGPLKCWSCGGNHREVDCRRRQQRRN